MDFITTPLVVAIIFVTIYKLFKLIVCRKERIMHLEYLMRNGGVPVPPAYDAMPAMQSKPIEPLDISTLSNFPALKWGCLLCGMGLGLLCGALLVYLMFPKCDMHYDWQVNNGMPGIIIGSSTMLFGGLGLVVAYLIGGRMRRNQETEE